MLSFINPTPILITLVTVFGILMHDMHIDKATTAAIATPSTAAAATESVEKVIISTNYHTHVERASLPRVGTFRSSLPNVQPPRNDDRRYIQNKKLSFVGGSDAVPLWPSV